MVIDVFADTSLFLDVTEITVSKRGHGTSKITTMKSVTRKNQTATPKMAVIITKIAGPEMTVKPKPIVTTKQVAGRNRAASPESLA